MLFHQITRGKFLFDGDENDFTDLNAIDLRRLPQLTTHTVDVAIPEISDTVKSWKMNGPDSLTAL